MHAYGGKSTQQFYQIISVRYRIHTVKSWTIEVKQRSSELSVERVCSSCKSTCTERAVVHSVIDITKSAVITLKHFHISAYMVGKCNRLGFLQMCEARHVGIKVIFHKFVKSLHKLFNELFYSNYFISGIESHIKCNLIITTTACMQFLSGISNSVDESCFYKTVNVFIFTSYL